MTDRFEDDLRDALRGRAAQLPADASTRVRQIAYRPRSPHARAAIALGSTGAAAGAAAIALFTVGLGASTQKALADWSATPTAPRSGQVQAAEAACTQLRPYPGEPALAGLTPKVADTRGPFTLLVYVDGRSHQDCIVGPTGHAAEQTEDGREEVAPANGIVFCDKGEGGSGVEGHRTTFVTGQAGADVTAVTLVLEDGTRVTATIANGWFAAWWPGTEEATAAQVTTTSGTTTEPLPQAHNKPNTDPNAAVPARLRFSVLSHAPVHAAGSSSRQKGFPVGEEGFPVGAVYALTVGHTEFFAQLLPEADAPPIVRSLSDEIVCLADRVNSHGAGGASCESAATAEQEGVQLVTGAKGSNDAAYAVLVPDGVDNVVFTDSNGSSQTVSVTNNVAAIEGSALASVHYVIPDGKSVTTKFTQSAGG